MAEYLSQGSDDSDLTDCDCFRLGLYCDRLYTDDDL